MQKIRGHTCNGLNIPQISFTFRYVPKNKENKSVNTAKLRLDFKIKMQMAKLRKLKQ